MGKVWTFSLGRVYILIQSSTASIESLGGGRYQSTIGVSPRFYIKNGVWRELTDALASGGDPNLNIGCSELFDFRIRNKLTGNAPVFHLGKGNSHIRMTPLDTNNVDGVVSGNSITFPEAWNNADLRYTLAGHILRKDIILREGHPTSFSFRVDDGNGLDDDLQGADFYAPAPYLYYPNVPGGMGSHIFYRQREVTVTKTTQGGKRVYTYTLPDGLWAGWVLDPTLTAQPDGAAGLDTYINTATPTANFSTATELRLYSLDDGYDAEENRTLIKFDLSPIPAGSTIDNATLTLTQYAGSNTDTLAVFRVHRAWVEAQATWNIYSTGNNWGTAGCNNTTNDREAANIGSLSVGTTAGAKNWTLTASKIQEMITGGVFTNNGFIVLQTSAAAATASHLFRSSDYGTAADRPKLVVNYTEGGGASVKVLSPTHRVLSRGVRVL